MACSQVTAWVCRDRLAFGEVRGSNAQLAAAFGVQSFPALIVVCNGDAETREAYSGDMKSEPIRRFLDQFTGGKRCRQVSALMLCV
jgi:thioredoxin-like negative regulator of GroEL